MLTIRASQMQSLDRQTLRSFEDEVIAFLNEIFPAECDELGPEAVRDIVALGVSACLAYEITRVQNVCIYHAVMFMLGINFDEDPEFAWAREILLDGTLAENDAVNRLYQLAAEAEDDFDDDEDEDEDNDDDQDQEGEEA